ncbi:uncharacterized protein LOC108607703 [Drosophila busckii]|uniref:uncharacterized protein LOC108607703 n=1 Tax=Drosophila busckii TaxID=30019 RepID=UPI00083EC1F9|nr:uncharacterized protein LOC108607703 [Drosophila busckii]
MTSIEAVLAAGIVHLFLRFALYIDPKTKLVTPGPELPTYIVYVALLALIHDTRILPRKFNYMSPIFKCICETIVAIFLLEISMLVFWRSIEHSIYLGVKFVLLYFKIVSPETYANHETLMIGAFTFPLAAVLLFMVLQVHAEHAARSSE